MVELSQHIPNFDSEDDALRYILTTRYVMHKYYQ
jgi:hypothetical protein